MKGSAIFRGLGGVSKQLVLERSRGCGGWRFRPSIAPLGLYSYTSMIALIVMNLRFVVTEGPSPIAEQAGGTVAGVVLHGAFAGLLARPPEEGGCVIRAGNICMNAGSGLSSIQI